MYAFAQMSGNGLATYEWNDEVQYGVVMSKKMENPNLKVMLAVGGYNHGVSRFSAMVSSLSNIEEFANNAITFLRNYNFDGLDLDWEYPAHRGSPAEDREKFTQLTMVLRQEFDKEGSRTNRPALLLSAAVSASKETVDTAYEIGLVSQYVDFINLMAYDFHGTWDATAGHNSPLYERTGENGNELYKNQNAGIQHWLSNGTPPEKLVLGLALYGRSFTLVSSSDVAMGSAVIGAGTKGTYTDEAGYLGYFEICDRIENGGWTKIWHNEHQVPYAYSGSQWVGFDDVQSFTIKAEYIKSMGLGGSMVWAMDLDDHNNICGLGENPMMAALKSVLESSSTASTISQQPSLTTQGIPTTTNMFTNGPSTNGECLTLPYINNEFTVKLETDSYKRVCYFTNWAQYRANPATFTAANIDANLCTHIMYAFAQMSGNGLATYEWNDEVQYGVVMSKKMENPNLKVMLAVGGYNHGVSRFSAMVSSLSNIEEFANNAITFLRNYNFDGLDLDWEYPAHRGSPAEDREKFTQLTMVLRQEFDKEGSRTNRPALLLSAAVSASKETVETAYEIGLVSQYVDFINLMAYDFHGTWDATAGHNSPLYERTGENGNELYKNQNAGIQHWLSNGTPPEKLVLGLALYGRSFTLVSSSDVAMGSAVIGAGTKGTYTDEAGYLGYFEICDRIENGGWTKIWHNEHQVPYAYSGSQWVGFDDVQSFTIKAEYIKSMGLGGSMVWAMDLDDHNNICGLGVNPMMTVLKSVLESSSTASTISQQPSMTTQGIPTTTNLLTNGPSTTGDIVTSSLTSTTNSSPSTAATSSRLSTSKHTTRMTQPSSEHTTTNSTATNVNATMSTLPTTQPANSPTTSANNCEPTVCPAGHIVPSLCDPSCVFQCCSGGNIQHCCQSGYTWNDAEEKCQMTGTLATTASINLPNCDVPSSCTHGVFTADQCDPQCYYNCAHGTAYHVCCSAGTLWDDFIKNCNYPHLIQYDPACHHSVCPAYQFLPDPCVPDCYYQCSSTGVDFRYCCSSGLLWDESIKNCNYPAAMPPTTAAKNTASGQATTSSQNGGQTTGTSAFHSIIFSDCSAPVTMQTGPTSVPATLMTSPTSTTSITSTPTSASNNCEPSVCPDGLLVSSLCDPSCVFQCCHGGNIEHCCQSGYTWNEDEEHCQMTVPVATTPPYNIPNCDVPSSCTHGVFTADQCDPQCYYNCAHGTAYHVCCSDGTLWDDFIKNCNYPHLIQYDPACHHSVCPAYEFLPDPCVPDCYYQCSSTGVDFRYCCSSGLLWDESIKNCNYPAAMPPTTAKTTASGHATTSSQNGGQPSVTVAIHQINFSNCTSASAISNTTSTTIIPSSIVTTTTKAPSFSSTTPAAVTSSSTSTTTTTTTTVTPPPPPTITTTTTMPPPPATTITTTTTMPPPSPTTITTTTTMPPPKTTTITTTTTMPPPKTTTIQTTTTMPPPKTATSSSSLTSTLIAATSSGLDTEREPTESSQASSSSNCDSGLCDTESFGNNSGSTISLPKGVCGVYFFVMVAALFLST
ncbi:chitinase 3 [Mizuhopecten yessoensis]|uniref:Chitinase 3 n=1 Tax=Mizuhopecten yessoensis TaxID=6573 RepID=A0A210QSP3_MIZYE|nr:chitinase 3 [Mizuhopecten yessoensis]